MAAEDERSIQKEILTSEQQSKHSPATDEPEVPIPAQLRNKDYHLSVATNETGSLIFQAADAKERLIFLATISETDTHILFSNGTRVSVPRLATHIGNPDASVIQGEETGRKEEADNHVTIQGFTGRTPVLHISKFAEHRGEKEFYVPVGYHPDPKDWQYTIWYNFYAWGKSAETLFEQCQEAEIGARQAVELTGVEQGRQVFNQQTREKQTVNNLMLAKSITPLPAGRNPKPMPGETRTRPPSQKPSHR